MLEYLVKYDYIAENLCVNKDKENLDCNGKCHLKNRLAEASQNADNDLPTENLGLRLSMCCFILPLQNFPYHNRYPLIEKWKTGIPITTSTHTASLFFIHLHNCKFFNFFTSLFFHNGRRAFTYINN